MYKRQKLVFIGLVGVGLTVIDVPFNDAVQPVVGFVAMAVYTILAGEMCIRDR